MAGTRLFSRGLGVSIRAHFSDGQWHNVTEALGYVGHLIPPEVAIRLFDRTRRGMSSRRARTLSEQIEVGRRRLIARVLRDMGAEIRKPYGYRGEAVFRLPATQQGVVRHARARFTPDDVRCILTRLQQAKNDGRLSAEIGALARDYGVDRKTIHDLRTRESYPYIPSPPGYDADMPMTPRR